jgi:hypothetical protein
LNPVEKIVLIENSRPISNEVGYKSDEEDYSNLERIKVVR